MEAWRLKMEPGRVFRLAVAQLDRIRIKLQTWIRFRIRIKVKSWTRISI